MRLKIITKALAILGTAIAAIVSLAILILILFIGFKFAEGYWKAGTWRNDSKNYERAFGTERPNEIEVINSKYTRHPHFTLEQEVYFEFVMSDSISSSWIKNGWDTVSTSEKEKFLNSFNFNRPIWFISDSLSKYKLYRVTSESINFPNNLMAIDTTSGHIFYASIQM